MPTTARTILRKKRLAVIVNTSKEFSFCSNVAFVKIHKLFFTCVFVLQKDEKSLLFTNILAPQIAGIKLIVYIVVWSIIFGCVQQKGWSYGEDFNKMEGFIVSAQTRFRFFAAIIAGLVGWQLIQTGKLPFPIVSESVTLGATQLVCQGLLLLSIAQQPLKVGIGILIMFSGFGLLYSAVEPALMVVGMLGVVDIAVALAICYLELVWKSKSNSGMSV